MLPAVDSKKLGLKVRQRRKELNMTQNQLSELCGVSLNMISHIEVGQSTPSLTTLLRISLALNAPLDYFLLETPYVLPQVVINRKIAGQLDLCEPDTLQAVSKMIDILIEQQDCQKNRKFSD